MAKLAAFEDWTPPWGEDDEKFDAETAKKLVYNLTKERDVAKDSKTAAASELTTVKTENEELKSKVTAFETKDLTEVEKLKRENEALRTAKPAKAPENDLELARMRVAIDKGLTLKQAARLSGTNEEELSADADEFIAEFVSKDEGNAGGNERPPSNRPGGSNGRLQGGLHGGTGALEVMDPAKLADLIPRR